MKYTTFGGQKVSRLGFGTAGYDGEAYHPDRNTLLKDTDKSVRLIRRALDLGINLFDTAPVYETEWLLKKVLPRNTTFISTKSLRALGNRAGWKTVRARNEKALEESLRYFSYIDFYFFHSLTHGVFTKAAIEGCFDDAMKWKEQGKIRFVGVSEDFKDANHQMLNAALGSEMFDVVMGVPNMTFPYRSLRNTNSFAMRAGLGHPKGYATALNRMDVVLIGTSSVEHLEEDVKICE